ncbi:MAG: relaxase/mobilization nuclease domain-containing protein [Lachnoclostridium sp.]|nr:relaxase/mobilization nuclease domain-containing protein [Lachnospira sp.]MCM1248675.1 relaxase/mobilization nuclease domain-containing protein [Lachnoclostridium sp.]
MAIIKSVKNSHSDIKYIINYVTKKEKTIGKKLCSGFHCNVSTAGKEMLTTKELYGKTGGRTYKHFVQSFPPEEDITSEQAHELAREYVERCPLFSDFEVLICTHVDKEHIHTHFVVNSVSFVDGHKFQMSKKDLEDMKVLNNNICLEHGFSICEIGQKKSNRGDIIAYDRNKYQFLKKAKEGKVKSYVQDTAVTVHDAMNESSSREEFIKAMEKKGYSVEWQDNHKYIVFINAEGKKVRNSNLQKTYNMPVGKEELIEFFKERSLKQEHTSRHRRR